jgi:hypothetical protein
LNKMIAFAAWTIWARRGSVRALARCSATRAQRETRRHRPRLRTRRETNSSLGLPWAVGLEAPSTAGLADTDPDAARHEQRGVEHAPLDPAHVARRLIDLVADGRRPPSGSFIDDEGNRLPW